MRSGRWNGNSTREEKERLEVSGLSSADLGVASSVSGDCQGATAGSGVPKKKKKGKQKRNLVCHRREAGVLYKIFIVLIVLTL